MAGDVGLVEVALNHWPGTDPNKKPRSRALECFKEAFDRSYQKHEGMALSDIVERAQSVDDKEKSEDTEEEKIKEISPEEETDVSVEIQEVPDGTGEEDEIIQSDDTPEDPGGEGDNGVRLGKPSWTDKERVVEETERESPMVALGDPRDPDAAEKRARIGG